jgi:Cytochrome P450
MPGMKAALRLTGPRPRRAGGAGERARPRRAQVIISLAAANRDRDRYPDADTLDIDRAGVRHLAFGHGIHHCLGAALARMEGQLALGSLLRRFPSSASPSPRRAALGPQRRPRAARPLRAASHSGTGRAQPASMIHSAAPRGRPARFADHLPPDSVRTGATAHHPAGPGHQPHHPEHPDLNRPRHRSAVCQMRPDDPAHDQADAPSSCMTEGR